MFQCCGPPLNSISAPRRTRGRARSCRSSSLRLYSPVMARTKTRSSAMGRTFAGGDGFLPLETCSMAEMQDGPWGEYRAWLQGGETGEYYEHLLHDATTAPERNALKAKVVKPARQPWENAPHGLIKHLVNEEMNTRAETLDAYMLVIPPGSKSGKIRQLAEQAVYIVEGRGYDLHVDVDLDFVGDEKYSWVPQDETQRFDWEAGDVV